ncbi:MAG: hypothetical protein LBU32_15580 [Clostridiales bacterium]|jgi:hypothetical protein|nr:hypothetical protein [Clostridiales bacterium]
MAKSFLKVRLENGDTASYKESYIRVEAAMPRAAAKIELTSAANDQWDKMWKLIDGIPGGAGAVAFDFGGGSKLKEARWDGTRICAASLFTCMSGISFFWIGFRRIKMAAASCFC